MIDLARYLVGEITAVSGQLRTFVDERAGTAVTVDDAFEAVVEFAGGAVGTIEATRFAAGPQEPARLGDQRQSRLARL